MQCSNCSSLRFFSDSYCPDCGLYHKSKMIIKSCQDIEPKLTDIYNELPNAEVFTGFIKSTQRYQRQTNNSNDDKEYGYWWVELNNGQETKEISFVSERAFEDSLNKGDVVTIYNPHPHESVYKTKGNLDKVVTNNEIACGIVKHNTDEQQEINSRVYERYMPNQIDIASHVGTGFILSILLLVFFIFMDSNSSFKLSSAAILGGIIWILISSLLIKRAKNKYIERLERYNIVNSYMELIKKISLLQLGGTHIRRGSSIDDDICSHCESRISHHFDYCCYCGQSRNKINHTENYERKENSLLLVPNEQQDNLVSYTVSVTASAPI